MSIEEIHLICGKYNIRNYTINSDGSIDVEGDVNLVKKNLKEIPLKFNKVSGYFDISFNRLTSLEGSPREVYSYFDCSSNLLTTLIGSPDKVHQYFYCTYNKLKSLEGMGIINDVIKYFLHYNPLESLDGYDGDLNKLECFYKKKLVRKKKLKILEKL